MQLPWAGAGPALIDHHTWMTANYDYNTWAGSEVSGPESFCVPSMSLLGDDTICVWAARSAAAVPPSELTPRGRTIVAQWENGKSDVQLAWRKYASHLDDYHFTDLIAVRNCTDGAPHLCVVSTTERLYGEVESKSQGLEYTCSLPRFLTKGEPAPMAICADRNGIVCVAFYSEKFRANFIAVLERVSWQVPNPPDRQGRLNALNTRAMITRGVPTGLITGMRIDSHGDLVVHSMSLGDASLPLEPSTRGRGMPDRIDPLAGTVHDIRVFNTGQPQST
jgi:hypothetical protein